MYLAREELQLTLPQIGESLGGRDHTTVIYGVDKITQAIDSDDNIRREKCWPFAKGCTIEVGCRSAPEVRESWLKTRVAATSAATKRKRDGLPVPFPLF